MTNTLPKVSRASLRNRLRSCYFLALTFMCSSHVFAQASFTAKTDFPLGASTAMQHIVSGDINSDGKPDAIVSGQGGSGYLGIFLNTTAANAATPSFSTLTTFTSGSQSHGVGLGDINGDGYLDIAIANTGANNASVFLNTTTPGATTPTLAAKVDFTTGTSPYGMWLTDVNGDGKPDMLVSAQGAATLGVFINTTAPGATTPSFAARVDFTVGAGPEHICVGDFNNDGKTDVAVPNNTAATVSILLNTTPTGSATPTFAAKADFAAGTNAWSVSAGDFNKDGRADLAVANRGAGTMSVLLNTTSVGSATASFAAKVDLATGSTPFGAIITDINADGMLDVAVTNRGGPTVSVFLNMTTPGSSVVTFAAKVDVTTATQPYFTAVADFNSDGKQDLATVCASSTTMSVFLNTMTLGNPTPTASTKTDFTTLGIHSSSIATGDINLDGKPDVVQGYESMPSVSVFLNTISPGSSTPSLSARTDITTAGDALGVHLADMNGDGKNDILATGNNVSAVSVLLNTTNPGDVTPSFAPAADFAVGTSPATVKTADFNGDGLLDLAVANMASNSISVLLSTTAAGASVPSFNPAVSFTVPSFAFSIAICDINTDGKKDIALASSGNILVSVLLNTTTAGSSTPSFSPATDFFIASQSYSVASGDFNMDGIIDLATADYTAGSFSILLNTTLPGATTPSFSSLFSFPTNLYPFTISVLDFNLDGKPDVYVANNGQSFVSLYLNTTTPGASIPSFSAATSFASLVHPAGTAVADFNLDGKPDLVATDYNTANTSMFLNTIPNPLPLHLLSFTGAKNTKDVLLSWQTADEANIAHFAVERSVDGSNFTSEGTVAPGGQKENSYTFLNDITDLKDAARLYYRLRMEEKDGSHIYSQTISFSSKVAANTTMTLYPNPVAGNVMYLHAMSEGMENISYNITDMTGAVVLSGIVSTSKPTVDISKLAKGTYVVTVGEHYAKFIRE